MTSIILNLNEDTKVISKFDLADCYSFRPKKQSYFGNVKIVSVYDPQRIENVIINKYGIRYKRVAKIIKDLLASDDTTETDYIICLDEIAKLKSMLLIKYQSFLKKMMFEYFLSDLLFLEKILQERVIEIRNNQLIDLKGREI